MATRRFCAAWWTYSLNASRPSLGHYGVISNNVDYIAEDTSGAIRLVVDGKEVMIAFGRDNTEATGIQASYHAVEGAFGDQAKPARKRRNVVMAWTNAPTTPISTSSRTASALTNERPVAPAR